uniref:Uncharacterized protein n=1 Tax=Pyxicephalus adspersus TaxID=30357 RepID=A0AAV3AAX1_PYXAD|nr:TPA: hypothetical protein GDO54_014611 [Pyxicephalus adspersus]
MMPVLPIIPREWIDAQTLGKPNSSQKLCPLLSILLLTPIPVYLVNCTNKDFVMTGGKTNRSLNPHFFILSQTNAKSITFLSFMFNHIRAISVQVSCFS